MKRLATIMPNDCCYKRNLFRRGWLAQLAERILDVYEVIGSSPIPPTNCIFVFSKIPLELWELAQQFLKNSCTFYKFPSEI